MSENQMMVMPVKVLKDLKTRKQGEIVRLKALPSDSVVTIKIDILEKQLEVIDLYIKKRGIT